MDTEIAVDCSPLLKIYKSGRIERLMGETTVPASLTPQNGVVSKDVVYSADDNLSVRMYIPEKAAETGEKLPLLVYFHGGGFIIETAFSPTYHTFLTAAVSASDCVAVSVDYRRAPEHPIPISFDDSWTCLKWVFTHIAGSGSESWLNKHADFSKVFLAGDSAGATIAHHMAMRAAKEKLSPKLSDSGISGIILVHPYFWSKTPIDEKETRDETLRSKIEAFWMMATPNNKDGADDPLINVVQSESVDISGLGCARRFPVVEKRWRSAFKTENESTDPPRLPTDQQLAVAFARRKRREGSSRGYGLRVSESTKGSDSWVDDPITRHIISLSLSEDDNNESNENDDTNILWPIVIHTKALYHILVLPLVEPKEMRDFVNLSNRSDCGSGVGEDLSLSSLLLNISSITGAFMVAHSFGDIVSGDTAEPEVVVAASPSVGGLFDSLTGSIGISTRPRPVAAAPVASSSSSSGSSITGAAASDAPRGGLLDKDLLRNFIASAMPFGTPLDLSLSNIFAMKANGFSSAEPPHQDLKQPAWKPYLYKGKQRLLFTIHETINAAMYDRDEIPDSVSVAGKINCRAELEGLPDVSFPLAGLSKARIDSISFHPCAQVPAHGIDKQNIVFQPPLGNFVLMRYQAGCGLGPPVKGFYQLSMVSEDEGAFLFKVGLMEGYKSPLSMEFCTITMPFPRRRIVAFDGTPSAGAVVTTEHSVEWRVVGSGRSLSGKSLEATFPGTIKFSPLKSRRRGDGDDDEESDGEGTENVVNVEDVLVQKMNKDLPAVEMEEPFCWQAYDYAKVSFKIVGASVSRMSIDTKSVNIYPTTKSPVEYSAQVTSGDYILWNTLGKAPSAAAV